MTLQIVTMQDNYAKTIIAALGGAPAVSKWLSKDWGRPVSVATVRMWTFRGVIPWKWRLAVCGMAASSGNLDEIRRHLPEMDRQAA